MRRALLAVTLTAMLAACGSVPRRPPAGAPAAGGGGYYKNDGPGAHPPPDLAAVPNAQPRAEPLDRAANRPYEVFNRRYVPLTRVAPFHQRGVASWYGKRFQGLKTSSGEPYNMYAMTAAHPTLPIPSYARVTDLANGRSVVVRINDRGPFWPGRIIDLSYAAAYKLGFAAAGSAEVEVDAIVPGETQLAQAAPPQPAPAPEAPARAVQPPEPVATAPDPAPRAAEPRGIYLQLGAFSVRANAESFREHVARELSWITKAVYVVTSGGLFKVHLGPYANEARARSVAARIASELNFNPMFVVR